MAEGGAVGRNSSSWRVVDGLVDGCKLNGNANASPEEKMYGAARAQTCAVKNHWRETSRVFHPIGWKEKTAGVEDWLEDVTCPSMDSTGVIMGNL